MSEFTAGNLTSIKYKGFIEQRNPTFLKQLNENWLVFFTEDTAVNDEVPEDVLNATENIPILYFFNFEDHGWGYSIIFKGKVLSNFRLSYELENSLLIELIQERYPDVDPIEFLFTNPEADGLKVEVRNSQRFKEEVERLFINCNLDNFELFELNTDQITRLKAIMSFVYLEGLDSNLELVDRFKEIVNLVEMSWIRSDRIDDLLE